MGCIIKIGNQSVSETDFLNHLNKIISVNKLFEENPEFSSQIYEALGFESSKNKLGTPEISDVEDGKLYQFRTEDGLIGGVLISPTEFRIDGISAYEVGKGQGTRLFEGLINYLSSNGITTLSTISAGEGAIKMHNKAVEKGLINKIKEDGRTATFKINSYIAPQQKQQAQQLYSQYLESLDKPNTNPILQGNQQEQVKKFAELQERLNNKEFLEGAKNAYENSEELKSFGTQEQYNNYIARVSLGIIKNPTSGELKQLMNEGYTVAQ